MEPSEHFALGLGMVRRDSSVGLATTSFQRRENALRS
jgi:hypothetical protein